MADTSKIDSSHKGVLLKQAREAKGLSLEMVHESTKIPMDALRAIEEGYQVRTLSPFYYRGFLKIYAKYLNVEMTDLIENYKPVVQTLPKDRTVITSKDDEFDFSEIKRAWKEFWTIQRQAQARMLGIILVSLFVVFKMGGCIIKKASSKKEKAAAARSDTIKDTKLAKKEKEPSIAPARLTTSSPTIPSAAPAAIATTAPKANEKSVTLTVRAKKKSWLMVKTDGRTVFQSTLAPGAVETWKASDRIELSGKNMNQLEFELNGKLIGFLSKKDTRAKEILITKEGLTVTK